MRISSRPTNSKRTTTVLILSLAITFRVYSTRNNIYPAHENARPESQSCARAFAMTYRHDGDGRGVNRKVINKFRLLTVLIYATPPSKCQEPPPRAPYKRRRLSQVVLPYDTIVCARVSLPPNPFRSLSERRMCVSDNVIN